jgi:hypothetical protein
MRQRQLASVQLSLNWEKGGEVSTSPDLLQEQGAREAASAATRSGAASPPAAGALQRQLLGLKHASCLVVTGLMFGIGGRNNGPNQGIVP